MCDHRSKWGAQVGMLEDPIWQQPRGLRNALSSKLWRQSLNTLQNHKRQQCQNLYSYESLYSDSTDTHLTVQNLPSRTTRTAI